MEQEIQTTYRFYCKENNEHKHKFMFSVYFFFLILKIFTIFPVVV